MSTTGDTFDAGHLRVGDDLYIFAGHIAPDALDSYRAFVAVDDLLSANSIAAGADEVIAVDHQLARGVMTEVQPGSLAEDVLRAAIDATATQEN